MVTLKNKQRRMRTFNLDAPFFVKRRDVTRIGKPETLTLLSLERREDLPDAILSCTEIKAARDAGTLRVCKPREPSSKPASEGKGKAAAPRPKAATKKTSVRSAGSED